MISKKTAIKLRNQALSQPPISSVKELDQYVKLFAALGFDDMEIFCRRTVAIKLVTSAEKKGFYAYTKQIKSTGDNLLYLSWTVSEYIMEDI
jgi:hypothetical protein